MPPSRVVIAATQVPFERGGAEWHARALDSQLATHGFASEIVQLPFQWLPREEVVRSALAWRMLDFSHAGGVPIDLLIATRFPSYLARHRRKIVWLFHQFRQAYDLHDAGIDGFADTPEDRALHAHVVALDTRGLMECRRIFTTSRNNAARLAKYNGLEATVLPLPLLAPESYGSRAWEPYVLSVGRLESLKRTELLVRAAAHLPPGARVVIVGQGTLRAALETLAGEVGAADRIEFRGFVDDAALKDLYARASAVFYAPWDEDYGLVTLEAFHSGKPVVTTTDAGGVLEFVSDGETGLVAPPEPEAIAARLCRLLGDPAEARRLGDAGARRVADIRWERVIRALTVDV